MHELLPLGKLKLTADTAQRIHKGHYLIVGAGNLIRDGIGNILRKYRTAEKNNVLRNTKFKIIFMSSHFIFQPIAKVSKKQINDSIKEKNEYINP